MENNSINDTIISDNMKKESKVVLSIMILFFVLTVGLPIVAVIHFDYFHQDFPLLEAIIGDLVFFIVACLLLFGFIYTIKYNVTITKKQIQLKTISKNVIINVADIKEYTYKVTTTSGLNRFKIFYLDKKIIINTRYHETLDKMLKEELNNRYLNQTETINDKDSLIMENNSMNDAIISDNMKKESIVIRSIMILCFVLTVGFPIAAVIRDYFHQDYPLLDIIVIDLVYLLLACLYLFGFIYTIKYNVTITKEQIQLKTMFKNVIINVADIKKYTYKRITISGLYRFKIFYLDKKIIINTRYHEILDKMLKEEFNNRYLNQTETINDNASLC